MRIDLAQFHQVFFEESFERLDAMETGLLNLTVGDVDLEEINTLFRAAHSIKGGSGTFGFCAVSSYTHILENLLDEMRNGRRTVYQSAIDLLLESVDCLRLMLTAMRDGREIDEARVAAVKTALKKELISGAKNRRLQPAAGMDEDQLQKQSALYRSTETVGWSISFKPQRDLLKTGNDPVRMFRELARLGKLTVKADLPGSPELQRLDPEDCHLSWTLTVMGNIPKTDIDDIFAWVEDECDLGVHALSSSAPDTNASRRSISVLCNENANSDRSSPDVRSVEPCTADSQRIETLAKATDKLKSKESVPAVTSKGAGSIRVETSKIDALLNMVGELVTTQSMLKLIGENFNTSKLDQLNLGLARLERHVSQLQESVMKIRMLPISFLFNRFPRLVHDLSNQLGKHIELKFIGEHTEIDKTVVELLGDPLVHLIRNSLDHGIEMPQERVSAGKPAIGTITLKACHRGGNIVIEVIDDGKGLDKDQLRAKAVETGLIGEKTKLTDKQTHELIFLPGFSTADTVTAVSGRGVGMDVVQKNIQALGGYIEIISEPGNGTHISIHVPLTLAVLDGQTIAVGDQRYIVPLGNIVESVKISDGMISKMAGDGEIFRLRNHYLPVIRLHKLFNVQPACSLELTEAVIVVVDGEGVTCGLLVDDVLAQQQVVIKPLQAHYRRIEGISAATIMGDGSVALILDIPGLIRRANR